MATWTWIGIDPGNSGGIAVLCKDHQNTQLTLDLLPINLKRVTEKDVATFLVSFSRPGTHCFIEKVGAYAVGGRRQGGKSMFTFGQSYGFLRGLLIAMHIPFEAVTPQSWQKHFSLIRKGRETQTEKKNRHKGKAEELYPAVPFTHATADALLIAEFCRRRMEVLDVDSYTEREREDHDR